jgi:hypothetical protein
MNETSGGAGDHSRFAARSVMEAVWNPFVDAASFGARRRAQFERIRAWTRRAPIRVDETLPEVMALARQGWSFARAYRSMSRNPVDVEQAKRIVSADLRTRERRFLEGLDRLVWPYPHSPARRLLVLAGAERGDVVTLIDDRGLEGALSLLKDNGV